MVNLTKLNIAALVLHSVLLLTVVGGFFIAKGNSKKGQLDVSRLAVCNSKQARKANQELCLKKVGIIPTVVLLFVFCVVTIVAHALYIAGRNDWYKAAISSGTNQWRYLEYGLSATAMILIIAALAGSRLVSLLLMFSIASVAMFAVGALAERAISSGASIKDQSVWLPLGAGFILFIGTWVTIGYNFFSETADSRRVSSDGKGAPSWVWVVYLAELVFFLLFGLIALWYAIKRPDFNKVETAYIILSFVAKATLVILLASGLLSST